MPKNETFRVTKVDIFVCVLIYSYVVALFFFYCIGFTGAPKKLKDRSVLDWLLLLMTWSFQR